MFETSLRQRKADLDLDMGRAEELAITDGINWLRRNIDGLEGVPSGLLEGTMRLAVQDADNLAAWNDRDEDPSRWQAVLRRVGDHLTAMKADLLSDSADPTKDDAGLSPEMADAVAEVRRRAGIPDAPTTMILGLLLRKLGRDGESAASWSGRHDDPDGWTTTLARVGRELREVWGALAKAWNPPSTDYSERDRTDDMNASDADWTRFKRSVESAQRARRR